MCFICFQTKCVFSRVIPLETSAMYPPSKTAILQCATIPSPVQGAPVAELLSFKSLQRLTSAQEIFYYFFKFRAKCLLLMSPFYVLRYYLPNNF